jgi:outer membrane protein TolC
MHSRSQYVLRTVLVAVALALGPACAHAGSTGLALDEAVRLSLQRSPLAGAAEASVQASRELASRAGQLPDPMLKVGIENVPVNGAERWSTSRDSMTMRTVGIAQQWVSADKRAARSERARRAVDMEEGSRLENVSDVRGRTASAWISVLYGQRTLALFKAIEKQTADDLAAVRAAHRGAKATAAEVAQAQLALSQAQDAASKAEQDLTNARLALTRWTFVPVESVADQGPPLASKVPGLSVEGLETSHPVVLAARRAIALADADTALAIRERRPDWSVEASFSQRPAFSNMISVGVSIPLPVDRAHRQDRDVAEKSALATKARLQYEDAVHALQIDIQSLSNTLESIKRRLARLNADSLPPAAQQVELATAAYRAGAGSLSAVFSARKMLLERQLQVTELEKEAALTWAKLEYRVVPHEFASKAEQ